MINKIRIVLANTSHPGNIGSSVRAMKNMGLSELYLVSPKFLPTDQQAVSLSAGASELLESAIICDNLVDAIADCNLVFATSGREYGIDWPKLTIRQAADLTAKTLNQNKPQDNKIKNADYIPKIAYIFGPERTGLTSKQLQLAHYHVQIPANHQYASLNLSQAVQIVSYELFMAVNNDWGNKNLDINNREFAKIKDMEGFYLQLEQLMCKTDFLDQRKSKHLMAKLRKLFNRSMIDLQEINILRGILGSVGEKLL